MSNENGCWMFCRAKIVMVYIYAMGGSGGYLEKAVHFVDSYEDNPPGMDHETVVVCNGHPADDHTKALFSRIPNCSFLEHDDSGWDIGGFQFAARTIPCDLMIFLGGHTYFRKPGWLVRIWDIYVELGDTLYGSTGSQGSLPGVHPHVRTTGFWCHPTLLSSYPYVVTQKGGGGQRYEMEHGHTCFTNWVKEQGLLPWIVGWDMALPLNRCDSIPNGFHRGDQSNVLIGDRLTAPPYHPTP